MHRGVANPRVPNSTRPTPPSCSFLLYPSIMISLKATARFSILEPRLLGEKLVEAPRVACVGSSKEQDEKVTAAPPSKIAHTGNTSKEEDDGRVDDATIMSMLSGTFAMMMFSGDEEPDDGGGGGEGEDAASILRRIAAGGPEAARLADRSYWEHLGDATAAL